MMNSMLPKSEQNRSGVQCIANAFNIYTEEHLRPQLNANHEIVFGQMASIRRNDVERGIE